MCMLIYKPAGKIIAPETLGICAESNRNGIGYAVARDGELELWKSARDYKEGLERIQALQSVPAIIHFRLATHGDINDDNTHPFFVDGDTRDMVAAHNGIISIESSKEKSDTRMFIEHVLANLRHEWWTSPVLVGQLESLLGRGNKFALLRADGTPILLNEKSGEWSDGIWYSNSGYRSRFRQSSWSYGGDMEDWTSNYNSRTAVTRSKYHPLSSLWPTATRYMKEDILKDFGPGDERPLGFIQYLSGEEYAGISALGVFWCIECIPNSVLDAFLAMKEESTDPESQLDAVPFQTVWPVTVADARVHPLYPQQACISCKRHIGALVEKNMDVPRERSNNSAYATRLEAINIVRKQFDVALLQAQDAPTTGKTEVASQQLEIPALSSPIVGTVERTAVLNGLFARQEKHGLTWSQRRGGTVAWTSSGRWMSLDAAPNVWIAVGDLLPLSDGSGAGSVVGYAELLTDAVLSAGNNSANTLRGKRGLSVLHRRYASNTGGASVMRSGAEPGVFVKNAGIVAAVLCAMAVVAQHPENAPCFVVSDAYAEECAAAGTVARLADETPNNAAPEVADAAEETE